jgi:hypothetical protein
LTLAKGTGAIDTFHPNVLEAISAIDLAVTLFKMEGEAGMNSEGFLSLSASAVECPFS